MAVDVADAKTMTLIDLVDIVEQQYHLIDELLALLALGHTMGSAAGAEARMRQARVGRALARIRHNLGLDLDAGADPSEQPGPAGEVPPGKTEPIPSPFGGEG